MLRKITLLLAIMILMCGCHFQSPPEPTAEPPVIRTSYPILFLDETNGLDQAYVLCAFEDGQLRSAEEYRYNGQELSEYLRLQAAEVDTDMVDLHENFTFSDSSGSLFQANIERITCTGRMIDETVEVRATMAHTVQFTGRWFLGTYCNVDIFPDDIVREENSISVDLDSDGVRDKVVWTFAPADAELYGEHYTCSITIEQNGVVYDIGNIGHLPIKEDDFALFIADVTLDGSYELIVYTRGMSKFGAVRILQFNAGAYTTLMEYIIDPEP